jgi:hypothetical protein
VIKKTITFTDLDGEKFTEDFYFNLSKAELAEIEISVPGGMQAQFQLVMALEDTKAVLDIFKELIAKAYGKRSDDNRSFIKSEEISQGFMYSDAYSELFMELLTDSNKALEFITGIMPADMSADFPKTVEELELPKDPKDMTKDELIEAFQARQQALKDKAE